MPLFHQRGDHCNLLRDVLDRTRFDMRWQQSKFFAIVVELHRPTASEILEGFFSFLRISDGLIIHVRDVADMKGANPTGFQGAAQHILKHERPEVPNVRRPINGGSTAIETKRAPIQWPQVTLGPSQGIEKPHAEGLGVDAP